MHNFIIMKKLTNIALLVLVVVLSACSNRELNNKVSNATGWDWRTFEKKNNYKFDPRDDRTDLTPFGMVAIQGGTFVPGENDEFLTAPHNSHRRSISVNSFYMDKYEISNTNWLEYIHWLEVVFGGNNDTKHLVTQALPDTTVWREDLAYNKPLEEYYFRDPAFCYYPVVGVSWDQATAYCEWRTDRANELILMQMGKIAPVDFDQLRPIVVSDDEDVATATDEDVEEWATMHPGYELVEVEVREWIDNEGNDHTATVYMAPYEWIRDHFVFNTAKYLYCRDYASREEDFGSNPEVDAWGRNRKVKKDDGILFIGYRLPTEAEWEFAAFAPIAGEDGILTEGKHYPWSGYHPRDLGKNKAIHGQMKANFVRARGDYMGVSGALNDHYQATAPVDEYLPNEYGLYNMAGNVNEWVMDVYRETSSQEVTEYNAFRGNIYSRPVKNMSEPNERNPYEYLIDDYGRIAITWDEDLDDKRDAKDGDYASRIDTEYPLFLDDLISKHVVDSINRLALLGYSRDTIAMLMQFEKDKALEAYAEANGVEVHVDPTDLLAPIITNTTRVYKGGSWKDRVYWLNPMTRRYMEQDRSSMTIGFRCAMSTVGTQIYNDSPTLKK